MGALIIALVPILTGAFAGRAIAIVLAGLTIGQWAAIAGAIANIAAPAVEDALKPEVEAALRALHPVLDNLWAEVKSVGADVASRNAFSLAMKYKLMEK